MVDMLVTGERARLDDAFEIAFAGTARRTAGWPEESLSHTAADANSGN